MNRHHLQFTFLALADIKRLWESVATTSRPWATDAAERLKAAEELRHRLERHCAILRESPEVGVPRDDLVHGLLSSAFGRYNVYYRLRGSRVEVVRVLRTHLDAAA